jgi:hypothetical protein
MKVIVLKGKPGTGKTTTFELLYEALVKAGGTFYRATQLKFTKDPKDFHGILRSYKGGKVNIGFNSMGDSRPIMFWNMGRYHGLGCDVFVCASSHELSENEQWLIKMETGHDFIPIDKHEATDDDNEKALSDILAAIDETIK